MIAPADPVTATTVATLRSRFRAERCPHLVVADWLAEPAAAALRARAAEGLRPFEVADRGRYHVNATLVDGPLFESLRVFAESVTDTPLELGSARWLRFSRGDYQLLQGDAADRVAQQHIEVTLDFSAAETKQADIVYTNEAQKFVLAHSPRALALVERSEGLHRYDRYLNSRAGDAHVWRLRLALLPAPLQSRA